MSEQVGRRQADVEFGKMVNEVAHIKTEVGALRTDVTAIKEILEPIRFVGKALKIGTAAFLSLAGAFEGARAMLDVIRRKHP